MYEVVSKFKGALQQLYMPSGAEIGQCMGNMWGEEGAGVLMELGWALGQRKGGTEDSSLNCA